MDPTTSVTPVLLWPLESLTYHQKMNTNKGIKTPNIQNTFSNIINYHRPIVFLISLHFEQTMETKLLQH